MDQPITNTQLPVEPPTTPPEQLPQITPKKSPITSIIIGLVFVTLVGVAGYFAYQYFMLKNQLAVAPAPTPSPTIETTDPTANWKTYTNQEVGFSFKYPQSWTISKDKLFSSNLTQDIIILDSNRQTTQNLDGGQPNFVLNVRDVNDWESLQAEAKKTGCVVSQTEKAISFGDNTFFETGTCGQYSTVQYMISTPSDKNHKIVFDMFPGEITSQEVQDDYNQLLSTFNFTSGAEKTSSTQNWKTFTNQEIGFSFKYPQSWTESNVGNNKGITLRTTELSREKRDGKTINYSFEVIMGENEESYNILKANTIKVLSPKNIEGKTFERYIVGDMYLSLNYIFESDAGNKIRFMLFPYGNTADEPVEQFAEIEQTIDQILSTFKFSEE